MKKTKTPTPFPEFTLKPSERRKRVRRMAAITHGTNSPTKRQIRRLPSRQTKHAARQERRLMTRYARRQGHSANDFLR